MTHEDLVRCLATVCHDADRENWVYVATILSGLPHRLTPEEKAVFDAAIQELRGEDGYDHLSCPRCGDLGHTFDECPCKFSTQASQ